MHASATAAICLAAAFAALPPAAQAAAPLRNGRWNSLRIRHAGDADRTHLCPPAVQAAPAATLAFLDEARLAPDASLTSYRPTL